MQQPVVCVCSLLNDSNAGYRIAVPYSRCQSLDRLNSVVSDETGVKKYCHHIFIGTSKNDQGILALADFLAFV
jgi:hypothetical protein